MTRISPEREPIPDAVGRILYAAFVLLVLVGSLSVGGSSGVPIGIVIALAGGSGLLWGDRFWVITPSIAVATVGIAIEVNASPGSVAWFGVCLLAGWVTLRGSGIEAVCYWLASVTFFAVRFGEHHDAGWIAWMAGVSASALSQMLLRRQLQLTAKLRAAQAEIASRSRDEERSRIARELHDVIAHTLTVSLLHLTSARLAIEHEPENAAHAIGEAERLSRASLSEVRTVVGLLGRDGSESRPLPGAADIPALIEQFSSAGMPLAFDIAGDVSDIPATVGLSAYRIVQESLTNAAKHAAGQSVSLHIEIARELLTVSVDNTTSAPVTPRPGQGTTGLRERAASLGGTCLSAPTEGGWRVRAELPLAGAAGRGR